MTRWQIAGGRVIDPAEGLDRVTDLWLADGRVVALGDRPDGFTADRVLEVPGQVVCPGLVDLSASLREPGHEHKASIASEAAAAAASGITTLCCPPDTDPVIDTPAVVDLVRHRAASVGRVRVLPIGALTQELDGERLSEMAALKDAGCVGVTNLRRPVRDTQLLRHAMAYAATFDLTVFLHPDEPWLRGDGCIHEGEVSARLGLTGIPVVAETVAVARDLALIAHTGVRAHFCRLSTAAAVAQVAAARAAGLPVTADVCAHQLHLTEMDVSDFDSLCHVQPPLRTQRDRDALRSAVVEGTLDAVCSDHQPHEAEAKLAPLPETEPGISALETLLPLTLRLVEDGLLDLPSALGLLTAKPAGVIGLPVGTLRPGSVGDVCIFDPDRPWHLDPTRLLSRGRNTPFAGWAFAPRVTHTLLGGVLVHVLEPAP
ncbi:MAG: dihydroorotase [Gammaproteobacteria bacterium]|nr:dihydroorotase [Gammaproteobacteria bacterium]